jgi:hypothetical protein
MRHRPAETNKEKQQKRRKRSAAAGGLARKGWVLAMLALSALRVAPVPR